MVTSNTTAFNLNLTEIVEEAFERAGSELRSGYDLKTARRSLNLLLIEWQNRGINLWTVDSGTIPLVAGTHTYDLPVDTVDLLDHVIRTDSGTQQTDIAINRISSPTYATIPNKLATGRPNKVYIQRLSGATDLAGIVQYPQITVWPVPDLETYTFVYWRMRRIQDATLGTHTQDVPFRFLPCLVAGLAYYLSQKLPEGFARSMELEASYEKQWNLAADEDRDKASMMITPRIYS